MTRKKSHFNSSACVPSVKKKKEEKESPIIRNCRVAFKKIFLTQYFNKNILSLFPPSVYILYSYLAILLFFLTFELGVKSPNRQR